MVIEDSGVIISVRKFGERSRIVSCLLSEHGMQNGIIRASSKKYNDGLYPGNLVYARWQARIVEHLGQYTTLEVTHNLALAHQNRMALYTLNAALSWLKELLMPQDPASTLYHQMNLLVRSLDNELPVIMRQYISFELALLQHLGRPLDLSICAATGVTEELEYISPKSGRAVSKSIGEPYGDRLLRLPAFLLVDDVLPSTKDIADGLTLTQYFLQRYLLEHYGKKIPEARNMLAANLKIT